MYHYCLEMWYIRSLERAGVIQKLTILERKNGLVLSNTRSYTSIWDLKYTFSQDSIGHLKMLCMNILSLAVAFESE